MPSDQERRRHYLEALGIQSWLLRDDCGQGSAAVIKDPPPPAIIAETAPEVSASVAGISELDWEGLRTTVAGCTRCDLCQGRIQAVLGVGNVNADWMFIGEAPGAEEDRQGEPFVGRAGQLLTAMLQAMGLQREQVYIANILKCRPPNNRDPRPEEVAQCEPFLRRQVALVRPRIIVALGRIAAHNLLKTDTSLGRLRGQVFSYGEQATPLVVTYHPAYLLRNLPEKRKAWEDLQFAMRVYNEQAG